MSSLFSMALSSHSKDPIPEKLVELKGLLERITYEDEVSGYTVAKVKVTGTKGLVTIVGNIPSPSPGAVLTMQGEWMSHPKFGEQFKVSFCSCSVPASIKGIEKYLGSGLIKGIGPAMAKRIVALFGEKTLDIIEESAEKLLKVEGMGLHRIRMIEQAWQEQKEIRTVMIFLQSYGVSTGYATKIYKKYGNDAITIVKDNPYRLAQDIFGIGFLVADQIAKKLGFDETSPLRAEAGILYVLQELTSEGHVYYPYEDLLQKAKNMLKTEEDLLKNALKFLEASNKIVVEALGAIYGVFLAGYHGAEVNVAEKLKKLRDAPKRTRSVKPDTALTWVQKKLSIMLAAKQMEAVKTALTHKLLVITGNPGTGKTTITKAILEIFSCLTSHIHLTAPTGRAAKRMSEATGHEAKTIHRLLEWSTFSKEFVRNEENPLDCDLLILDEVSMVDTLLMYHLLKAVPAHATLIMVGDINQLPSVGAGSILKDIIRSAAVEVVELNEIFRQARQSTIIVNSHHIIQGHPPDISNAPGTDFFFLEEDDQDKVCEKIIKMVQHRIPQTFGYDAVQDVQVLTPMHRGIVGTQNLNDALQNALNPRCEELVRSGVHYRLGDKVMQIRNNYDKDVFNGDIGLVSRIDAENNALTVTMDGRAVPYEALDLEDLTLSYAVSIHKSQGSEYPVVVIPLVMSHFIMLQRNLIYTGITRGKKLVVVIGSQKALFAAVNNNKIMNRNTWLGQRLAKTVSL
ncbi:ATP-dependent RecD-like DNA helicase [Alphaproteobacteria bacterium]|nr:ATP-dependent RecD-like DNA helicase [Alphaproteobacteria bacterium]